MINQFNSSLQLSLNSLNPKYILGIKKILFHLSIILSAIILTVIFTWPFASKLGTFYYDRGDYPITGSILSYNEYSIKTGKIFTKEYFNGNEFYPQPYTLIYFDFRLLPSLIYSPIFWLTQNFILSVNLTTFMTFILSFIFSFYAINYFVKNSLASIIGATIYAFNPLTFSRFPEHFDLLNKYLLPLVFLFAYKFLRFPNIKNSFYFFLIFTLNAFSAIYFQIFTTVTLFFFAIPFFIYQINKKNKIYFLKVFMLSFIFLIFLPIFLYFNKPYWNFSKAEGVKRSLNDNIYFSARVIDYFSSTKQNFLYGTFTKSLDDFRAPKDKDGNFNYLEHSLFLNIIPMFLFGIFIFYIVRNKVFFKDIEKKIMFYSYFILLLFTFVLSFGPYFQGWNNQFSTNFKLPYYYLYQIIPLLKASRAPARLEFLFYVPFSLFVSFGVYFLFKKINKKMLIISLFTIILIGLFLENFNLDGPVVSFNEKSSVIPQLYMMDYQNKLAFLKGKKTLHLPVKTLDDSGLDSIYLNWASVTGETIVNGNGASYIPKEQINFLSYFTDKIDEKALKKLIAVDVDYIIIHQNLEKYETLENLYKQAIIYNNNNIVILDLKKFQFPISKCNFEKDINLNFKVRFVLEYMQTAHLLYLKNKSDCYLTSIYDEKYKNMKIKSPDLYGNFSPYTLYFKLPPVIEPFEEIILSEEAGDLRIE